MDEESLNTSLIHSNGNGYPEFVGYLPSILQAMERHSPRDGEAFSKQPGESQRSSGIYRPRYFHFHMSILTRSHQTSLRWSYLSPLLSNFLLECNGIRGSIPQQIGNLIGLTELYLGNNSLNVAIPSAIAKLPNLALLNLSRNQLEDSIPMDLGKMKSLEFISLYNNSLSGTIPKSLGSLEHLRWLD